MFCDHAHDSAGTMPRRFVRVYRRKTWDRCRNRNACRSKTLRNLEPRTGNRNLNVELGTRNLEQRLFHIIPPLHSLAFWLLEDEDPNEPRREAGDVRPERDAARWFAAGGRGDRADAAQELDRKSTRLSS